MSLFQELLDACYEVFLRIGVASAVICAIIAIAVRVAYLLLFTYTRGAVNA